MASSKARSGQRPASAKGGRPAGGSTARSARTVAAVTATPTSPRVTRPAAKAVDPEPAEDEFIEPEEPQESGPPLWLQIVSFVLAILGLVISIYETWAEEFNSSHLAGCPTGGHATFDCGAVLTSPQSHVFGVIPVAVLGILFYVAAVPLFSPWAWRFQRLSPRASRIQRLFPWAWRVRGRDVALVRLASAIIGMGFVVYLIYAELYQVREVCEYCTGVHIVTFLLFCITVFSAAIWGLGASRKSSTSV
jgi:uncharacterized membrane protein